MKGNADPRDVTAGALGMLAHAGLVSLILMFT